MLVAAWRAARLAWPDGALVLAGVGSRSVFLGGQGERSGAHDQDGRVGRHGSPIVCLDPLEPAQLRDVYAACDVLVVPSVSTRTFREPWGLVVNEAMNRGLAVIATDAVGAAAGGLVRDGHNGLIVPAGDSRALAEAIARLAADRQLRSRMGSAGSADVLAFSHDAWAEGFSRALSSLGLSRTRW